MSSLPPTVYSSNDVTSLTLEIRAYAKWYRQYVNAARVGTKLTAEQPDLTELASNVIRQWSQSTPLSPERIDQLIEDLETTARHAPSITITLAAPAPAEVKHALVMWCRSNLHPDMLVTVRFSSTIAGGMVVRLGSRMYDWSWKRLLMEQRSNYAEVLRRV